MMKKRNILTFGLIAFLMSSCVYSLFPIYTEDTVVFKPELLGKWNLDNDGSFIVFETLQNQEEKEEEENEMTYSIEIKEGFTMSSDSPLFLVQNGQKIFNEDSIKAIMLRRLSKATKPTKDEKKQSDNLTLVDEAIVEKIKEKKESLGDASYNASGSINDDISYQGSITVYEEKSYKATVVDSEGNKEIYVAHLVEIGEDLFMDLYPEKEFDSKKFTDNFFPVHTFYKVAVSEHEFSMTYFDLDKLNKLFESNLIRLRHENVEGSILITAQPKELQKFLNKYSDDESVFDATETYQKAI